LGAPAESAVLELLKEKDPETRSEACKILKVIGTAQSLPAFNSTMAKGSESRDVGLAKEALKAIQSR
jgi:hypothetical protein